MSYILSLFKNSVTAILFMAMFILALLAICTGVVFGGIFELGKAASKPFVRCDKSMPVVGLGVTKS